LGLSNNSFYGNLPNELAELTNLKTLILTNNTFKGNYVGLKNRLPNIINFELDEANLKDSLAMLDTVDNKD
jgi:hypothetical protein